MFKKIAVVIMTGVVLLAFANPAQATPGVEARSLPLNTSRQLTSSWCWSASVQSAIRYVIKKNPSQCSIVKAGKGLKYCPYGGGSVINEMTALRAYGIKSTWIYSSDVTLSYIKNEIRHHRPMIISMAWTQGGGHASVVRGFRGNNLLIDFVNVDRARTISVPFNSLIRSSDHFYPSLDGRGTVYFASHHLQYLVGGMYV